MITVMMNALARQVKHLQCFSSSVVHQASFSSSSSTTTTSTVDIFDRRAKLLQRERAAMSPNSTVHDYLRDICAERTVDRLYDISRHFPLALDIGCGTGHIGKLLRKDKVDRLIQCDISPTALMRDSYSLNMDTNTTTAPTVDEDGVEIVASTSISSAVVDEEFLPFGENQFDAVLSSGSLHWVNDLPGTLAQIKYSLKPDGVFLASMFGGDTLFQLRSSLQLAEQERRGGFSPRTSPLIEMRDVGSLLQRAGFSISTVDVDEVTIGYPSIFELINDLRSMGESNATWSRQFGLSRDTLLAAGAIYETMYPSGDKNLGGIAATFQMMFMVGWKPAPGQKEPARRGSGTVSLQDLPANIFKK